MGEKQRVLDLLDRAYRAQAWHGPSILETLEGVSAATAAKHPLKGVHSIWELVEHMASWNEIVARRLAGEKPVVTPELNFPPVVKTTPAAWKATLKRLARAHARFRREVASFPVTKLGRRRPRVDQTWNVLIHGQIQHGLYHAGQIAMLRRALGKPVPSH
ncbi:MAG: DinB family protein [Candidatus Eisenbacteria bacterium]|uniref:DinB family protein n=1 Tax=Eiseniibacteriota bacterium TaxID=2212470 RepID=A0A849SJN3_UNCEI|nr:DinB family protein [Candidatus Eisenbacteria bacterium]